MAPGKTRAREVELGRAPINRFRDLLEAAVWSELENSIQGWVGPFVSDRSPRTWQALITFRYRPGDITF